MYVYPIDGILYRLYNPETPSVDWKICGNTPIPGQEKLKSQIRIRKNLSHARMQVFVTFDEELESGRADKQTI